MVSDTEPLKVHEAFTDDEAALYDRQIRLWGVEAQKRLNNAKVLIIGLGGVGAELAKNIILGGVKSVTLLDPQEVTELDSANQFLIPRDAKGQNRALASLPRAQLLNPMVEVLAEGVSLTEKDPSFFTTFNIIIATNCDKSQLSYLNGITREHDIKFLAADVFGFFGFIFLDLGEHPYKTEVINMAKKKGEEGADVVGGVSRYISFQDAVSVDWNLDEFAKKAKKMRPGLFGLFVLLEFFEKEKRKPAPGKRESDLQLILKLRDDFIEQNGLRKEMIPDEFFTTVFGEAGPSSAITGGVLAQEVVKALSGRDPPLVNFFLSNPLQQELQGYVENLVE